MKLLSRLKAVFRRRGVKAEGFYLDVSGRRINATSVYIDKTGNRFFMGQTAYGRGRAPPGGHKPIIIIEGDATDVDARLVQY